MTIETIDRYLTKARAAISRAKDAGSVHREYYFRRTARNLKLQRLLREGFDDCAAGRPCRAAVGSYLDGYHGGDGGLYYVCRADLDDLSK
jgi:hypothetical protein